MTQVINLADKLSQFSGYWAPKIVAQMNEYHFKLVKVAGEFTWHSHPDTDEVFMVLRGQLEIALPDRCVTLKEGELFVVPQGVAHRPSAAEECHLLLVEPAGTTNTGDSPGDMTAPNDAWI